MFFSLKAPVLPLACALLAGIAGCSDEPDPPLYCAIPPCTSPDASTGGNGDGDGDENPNPFPNPGGEFDNDADGGTRDAEVGDDASAVLEPFEGEGTVWKAPAPRATCGTGDKPDGELQGASGNVSCNVDILGQVEAPHFLSLAWYKDCAYVNGSDGTTVVHVDSTGKPSVTDTLTQPGFRSNWETMKANAFSGLLAGYESNGSNVSVFDVATDCKKPTFKSTINIGGIGHAGNFSSDGTIYYASSMYTAEVIAIDYADPSKPSVLSRDFDGIGTHDLNFSKDGNRGYFTYPRLVGSLGQGSMAIMDVSELSARKPNPKGKLISELTWPDGNVSQYTTPISIRGKDHLLITDELGSGNCDDPEKPIWGYARILDISDEQNPTLVSLIKTEATDPAHCGHASQPQGNPFGVGTHYCNVDRLDDPRLLACGFWEGGVRVFDIRNPWQPKEVAYFDTDNSSVPGLVRIVPETRQMWVATIPNTFYVFKFRAGSAADIALSSP